MPSLQTLIQSHHEIVLVVSQPDRGRGRGRKRSPSPVAASALAAGLSLLRPESLNDAEAAESIRTARPDLGIVLAFGQFIPKNIRTLPSCGYCINAHASLLPRFRGAAPIARAILEGEPSTGISIMRVEREMDAGPVALSRSLAIREGENTQELTQRLGELAGETLMEAVARIQADSIEWTEQDPNDATLAPRLEGADRRLDWFSSCRALVNRIHALAPQPGAVIEISNPSGAVEPLRILRAHSSEDTPPLAPDEPGTLRLAQNKDEPALRIATADGWLVVLEVQRAGGRAMETGAFLRGYPLRDGTILTSANQGESEGV